MISVDDANKTVILIMEAKALLECIEKLDTTQWNKLMDLLMNSPKERFVRANKEKIKLQEEQEKKEHEERERYWKSTQLEMEKNKKVEEEKKRKRKEEEEKYRKQKTFKGDLVRGFGLPDQRFHVGNSCQIPPSYHLNEETGRIEYW
jgi:hypothetical protein